MGPRPLPGRLRQSRKAPVPSVAPGQGRGRRLPSGGAECFPGSGRGGDSQHPIPGSQHGSVPLRRSAMTNPTDQPLLGSSRVVPPALLSGQGDKDTQDWGYHPREDGCWPPGLVCCVPPVTPCPRLPPPRARAGWDPSPKRNRAVPRPRGWQRGFPHPTPHREHPVRVPAPPTPLLQPPSPGVPGVPGQLRLRCTGRCRLPAAARFAPRQGEPATKPLLLEQTAGPGQGTAEYS